MVIEMVVDWSENISISLMTIQAISPGYFSTSSRDTNFLAAWSERRLLDTDRICA